jgi:hypothetical protein
MECVPPSRPDAAAGAEGLEHEQPAAALPLEPRRHRRRAAADPPPLPAGLRRPDAARRRRHPRGRQQPQRARLARGDRAVREAQEVVRQRHRRDHLEHQIPAGVAPGARLPARPPAPPERRGAARRGADALAAGQPQPPDRGPEPQPAPAALHPAAPLPRLLAAARAVSIPCRCGTSMAAPPTGA